ncbi:hypothetical protein ASPWEDRAFT_36368 [Aspergillus wentii DTO 134E9]|uniref:LTD domain-containing protein n=1 Tax=Aspergillus wentii DTO 134E9 TaxID=1073089 RepID=A0A1L9RUZ5_ASPWE|nr:uncharacterized protein ASPWEDRAFT_36368 [Aspergillus wentii DTO 134E9]OJJ38687.1 hypothetical protein ASPWEDRAFT_36368 [Aspergillus wentii DTO 134E9]
MPVEDYGVWKSFPITFNFEHRDPGDPTPHLYLYFVDKENRIEENRNQYPLPPSGGDFPGQTGRHEAKPGLFEAAINIKSGFKPNPLLAFWYEKDFKHPITDRLKELDTPKFYSLQGPSGRGLDYIRSNLFQTKSGKLVPHDTPEKGDDIIDLLHPLMRDVVEKNATLYIFGSRYESEDGIHQVHMNQGNYKTRSDKWYEENGIFQDGGLIIHYSDEHNADKDKWVAVFLAFATQATHTRDTHPEGVPVGDETWFEYLTFRHADNVPSKGAPVLITEALVNPVGPDGQPGTEVETVTLTNVTDENISLDTWKILNSHGDLEQIWGISIGAKGSAVVQVPDCPLSNNGDTITLLDPNGMKVHGVSYNAAQARRPGKPVVFSI